MLFTGLRSAEQRVESVRETGKQLLQVRLLQFSFFNLLIVALLGLLLRAYSFLNAFPFSFKNVLHGHSHFAFGGWLMPVLLALILKLFPELRNKISYRHWRNIAVLLLVSAYGMLLSFPVQGYKTVSIIFSTLSIIGGFYLSIVIWHASRNLQNTIAIQFLKWGLVYLSLSAIGPFATGPLIVLGYQGTPVYYNAIYFYLHFQYNGWFSFAVLALIYQLLAGESSVVNGNQVLRLMNIACIPTYLLSILWCQPGSIFNIVGGLGAFLQLIAFIYLIKDVRAYSKSVKPGRLVLFSISALFLKLVLQAISAIPAIALLAYQYRNFVIAYLHLVLLGFISLFVFASVFNAYRIPFDKWVKTGIALFLFSFLSTESLLVGHELSVMEGAVIPGFAQILFLCSLFFPLAVFFLCKAVFAFVKKQCSILKLPNYSKTECLDSL